MKITDKFKKCPGIYVFTNLINGKIYVGETVNMSERMRNHRTITIQIIDKAIQKYGWNNFDIQITYYPYADKKFLVNLEHLLIKQYKSLINNGGYNVHPMGKSRTGYKHTPESRAKMSKILMGNTRKKGKTYSVKKEKLSKKTRTKLSDGDILDIRISYQSGERQCALAKKFNVHYSTISCIVNLKRRKV